MAHFAKSLRWGAACLAAVMTTACGGSGGTPPELRETPVVMSAGDWEGALAAEVDRLLAAGGGGVHETLARVFERTLIMRALAYTGGRRIEAATALGIGRNTITRKIQELGIDHGPGADSGAGEPK